MANEISGRGRRSRDEKGNKGVEDFRFINILQFFSLYDYYFLSFFSIAFLPGTFNYPHPHPRPTTSTHYLYPRPLPTTHDPRHLATLFTAAGLAQSVERLTAEREVAGSIPGTGPKMTEK